jgi:hypothetical protein
MARPDVTFARPSNTVPRAWSRETTPDVVSQVKASADTLMAYARKSVSRVPRKRLKL